MTVQEFYKLTESDYQVAQSRLMNDLFITKMLKKFAMNDYYQPILDAHASHDVKKLFDSIHALKGVAGNLSLTSLYELSSVITEKVRGKGEGDPLDVDEEIKLLGDKYKNIVELINLLP